jgi:hypothetical protein
MLPSMALEITKIKHPLARQEAIPSYEIGLVGPVILGEKRRSDRESRHRNERLTALWIPDRPLCGRRE